jgi:hypothetical protein
MKILAICSQFTSYLSMYASIAILGVVAILAYQLLWIIGAMRASRNVHQLLVTSLLGSTFRLVHLF